MRATVQTPRQAIEQATEQAIEQGSSPWNAGRSEIPLSIMHEFRRQDIERQQFIISRRQQDQADLIHEEFLEQEARAWQRRCWVCEVIGAPSDHELYYYERTESQEARWWMIETRREIRYARYSGCFQYGMPQRICTH